MYQTVQNYKLITFCFKHGYDGNNISRPKQVGIIRENRVTKRFNSQFLQDRQVARPIYITKLAATPRRRGITVAS